MSSDPFEYITLTTGMYVVLLILVLTFGIVTQTIFQDSVRIRLSEISNQIAAEITEASSLCSQSTSLANAFFKPLDIPTSVGVFGYVVTVQLDQDIWILKTNLEFTNASVGKSPLWKKSNNLVVETGNGTIFISSYQIYYCSSLHSGCARPVVWATKSNGITRVGIGEIKS